MLLLSIERLEEIIGHDLHCLGRTACRCKLRARAEKIFAFLARERDEAFQNGYTAGYAVGRDDGYEEAQYDQN